MEFESLAVVSEVSAALAGFASLVGLLRQQDRTGRRSAFGVVETSLIALVFSLLPRVVVAPRLLALAFLFVWSAAWMFSLYQYRKATGHAPDGVYAPLLFRIAVFIFQLLGSTLAFLIVIGIWPERTARLYEAALLCPLLISCLLLWLTMRAIVLSTEDPPAT